MTNELIKTNFFTNYMEITNIGLNSDTILKLSQNSSWEIIGVITSIILCIIPICINWKLWKKNEELKKINMCNNIISRLTIYIKRMYELYYNVKHNIGFKDKKELFNKTISLYYRNIESIIYSFKMLKSYINNTYDNHFSNLNTLSAYLNGIVNKGDYNNTELTNKLDNYFISILYYCDIIITSINLEINKIEIKEEDIDSIYKEIEKIQNELNEILK